MPSRSSAYYRATVSAFLEASDDQVAGALAAPHALALTPEQLAAWRLQMDPLRGAVFGVEGWLHLEFDIPRLGRRVDAVLVSGPAIVPIEFKVGARKYDQDAYEQTWDYGLDLKNFHAPSHGAPIFPILCATEATDRDARWRPAHTDGVRPPFRCSADGLREAIRLALALADGPPLDGATWSEGMYAPTPTIIEAARALYGRHTVHDITRSDAGARNLAETAEAVEQVIADARARRRKAIIFVTGVPGAGKTLVGLNVATRHSAREDVTHAVFLSGNGPLVSVLREALARDEHARKKAAGEVTRLGTARSAVKAFIQNVHHFRDDHLRDVSVAPVDHVVVFDEAQRAWDQTMLARFMKTKKGVPGFVDSEPTVLLGAMDRHDDWAVVVCLVGGGQEINTGEAGIGEWIASVRDVFTGWDVHASPELSDAEYAAQDTLASLGEVRTHFAPALHLSTSMRSFRAERVSQFVKVLLDGDALAGRELLGDVLARYPVVLTRSLRDARRWLRRQRRGTERTGVVASSSAERLKPHAIDIRVKVNPVHWFLATPEDTRASSYLEDAATEFQVQGLELDWTCVTWDADLRWTGDGWSHHRFRGKRWEVVRNVDRQRYLLNAYRVLLTRARQGMVLFVPKGSRRDRTRLATYYDGTYEYLRGLGVPLV
jgi:hypothetical protein